MLVLCSFVPCNCFCYLFIVFVVSFYLFVIFISTDKNVPNKSNQIFINGENPKSLTDILDRQNVNKMNNSTAGFSEENYLNICYSFLLVMSMCMFLFCNTFPEFCFRKRMKLDKCQNVIVEKECGCTIVYQTLKEP